MIINRDNYETIFLMYVDNELSTSEKIIVEDFISGNEDLQEEMKILQGTVLPDDDLSFVPKTRLYKNASPVESVQESLLLLLDKELGQEYAQDLFKQINENPEVKIEWTVLQQTVLDKNEAVVFADKKLLHRYSRRIMPMRFLRLAAAVIIGWGIFTGISLYKDRGSSYSIAENSGARDKPGIKPATNLQVQPVAKRDNVVTSPPKTTHREINADNNSLTVPKVKSDGEKSKETKLPNSESRDKEPLRMDDNYLARQADVVEKKILPPLRNEKLPVTSSPQWDEVSDNTIVFTDVREAKSSFTRLDIDEENPDRILNIEEDKITRSKLGGIIRQVKRVVERSTKIKTSNGLRIGGFEIAIK